MAPDRKGGIVSRRRTKAKSTEMPGSAGQALVGSGSHTQELGGHREVRGQGRGSNPKTGHPPPQALSASGGCLHPLVSLVLAVALLWEDEVDIAL